MNNSSDVPELSDLWVDLAYLEGARARLGASVLEVGVVLARLGAAVQGD